MKKFILLIICFSLVSNFPADSADKFSKTSEDIRINQLGYYSAGKKVCVIVNSEVRNFSIVDAKNKNVYSYKITGKGLYDLSGEKIKIADFSNIKYPPGIYWGYIQDKGYSYPFKIQKRGLYKKVFIDAIRTFYYQRASMSLKKKYAGKYFRKAGHPDNKCILHKTTGKKGKLYTSGGWYDAGDYGKYIVNAGITVSTLLSFYQMYPKAVKDNDLNIPESGNGQSDLLDEIKYELDWMQTMQDSDGGVFFKVGPLKWTGFVMPKDDHAARYVIGKSTTSTLNFVAVMAQAARIYKGAYAKKCLKAAIKAWQWAKNNPEASHPSETGGTGPYDDQNYKDEFFWAASELYITTKKNIYKEYLQKKNNSFLFLQPAWWQYVKPLAFYSMAGNKNYFSKKIRRKIIFYAETVIDKMNKNPYAIPLEKGEFGWGSNSVLLNYGVALAYAHKISGEKKFLNGVINILDYVFGKNATGYSFVTGYGSRSPMYPHHRPSGADNIKEPIPGFIVGGPNKDKQDKAHGVVYKYQEPARSYADMQPSYASNEVAINWNAPLVFLLGYVIENEKKIK